MYKPVIFDFEIFKRHHSRKNNIFIELNDPLNLLNTINTCK